MAKKKESKNGRPASYTDPAVLLEKSIEYIEWCQSNPMGEDKIFNTSEGLVHGTLSKMRAPTVQGLCLYLKIDRRTWYIYAKQAKFNRIIRQITDMLYVEKFTGAAAGLLHPNIIARDLGLVEKSESTVKNINMSTLTDEQLQQLADGADVDSVMNADK